MLLTLIGNKVPSNNIYVCSVVAYEIIDSQAPHELIVITIDIVIAASPDKLIAGTLFPSM